MGTQRRDRHPLATWAEEEDLNLRAAGRHLKLPFGVIDRIIGGSAGCSWDRARRLEKRTEGKVSAPDIMDWHARYRARRDKKAAEVAT